VPNLIIRQLQHPRFPAFISFNKPLSSLSSKTVTTKVRQTLRRVGFVNIKVSCKATFTNGRWIGKCIINGHNYIWEVY